MIMVFIDESNAACALQIIKLVLAGLYRFTSI